MTTTSMSLLRRLRRFSNHAKALDSHPVQDVERLDNRAIGKRAVGFEEDGAVFSMPQERAQAVLEETSSDRCLVDVVETVARDRQDDRVFDPGGQIRRGRLWQRD